MLKLVLGLLTYKQQNKDLYDKDLTKYPDGFKTMEESVSFMGDLKDMVWFNFLLFVTYF